MESGRYGHLEHGQWRKVDSLTMLATESNLVDQMTDQTIQTSCHSLRDILKPFVKGFVGGSKFTP